MNTLYKRASYQILLTSLLFVMGLPLFSQVSNNYVLRVSDGEVQEKMVYEVIRSLDPSSIISISGQHVKVRVNASIDVSELLSELRTNSAGNYSIDQAATEKVAAKNFPVQQNTGDPAHDEAVYTAEKRAWILANPEAYKAMNEQNSAE